MAADGRWHPASVVVAIRTRTECGERIVRQTALGSVTVWRTAQQIDPAVSVSRITHSTPCTNSELGVSPRFTALSIFIQQRLTLKCREIAPPVWTQLRSRDFSSYSNRLVKPGQHGRNLGRRQAKAAQLRRAGYAHTGPNSDLYEYICKYVNQRLHWTLR